MSTAETLRLGDHLYVHATKKYFKIIEIKRTEYLYTKALAASEKASTIELTELKSTINQIYHVRSIGLEHNVKLWMRFREKDLFGITAAGYIDLDMAPVDNPWELDKWMYNFSPYIDIENQEAIAISAITHFFVTVYTLEEVVAKPPGYLEVEG